MKELSEEPGREVQDLFERSWPAKDALRQTFEKAAPRLKRKGLRHPRKSTCVPFMASCVDGFATLAKGSEMSSTKSLKALRVACVSTPALISALPQVAWCHSQRAPPRAARFAERTGQRERRSVEAKAKAPRRGVCWAKRERCWIARISVDGRRRFYRARPRDLSEA